jgi:hypothetical protein
MDWDRGDRDKAGDYLSTGDMAKVMGLVCRNAPEAVLKEVNKTCQETFEKFGISCCQPTGESTCQSKLVEMFEIALINGLPWDSNLTKWAVSGGFVEILKMVRSNGYAVDLTEVCLSAIEYGKLEVLEWAILSGYEMDDGMKMLAKQKWPDVF